jgi:outer membrane receptor protein involved in Fe transport
MEELHQERSTVEWRHGLYLEAELDLGRGLTVTPGARADYYRLNDGFAVDPRLSARWRRGRLTVRGGLGRYSQPPIEFQSDPVFGDPGVRPSHAIHYALGVDRRFGEALALETTLFYKTLDALVVGDEALVRKPDGTLAPRGYGNLGSGRVYGAEILFRHDDAGRLFGWLAYTLSRAERRDTPEDELRPFSFDQTHILTLVGNLRLPRRFQTGLRLRYVTGNPSTPVLGSIYDADSDVYFPVPGAVNSERVGDFLQLDLRVEKRFDFEDWHLTAYLDVQNATNRANPEAYFYSYDYRERRMISGLPVFPALGVRGEF